MAREPLTTVGDTFPLTLTHILRRMRSVHRDSEVVTQLDADGRRARASFAEVADRADRLGAALLALGIERGDRVGTFAWNAQAHLEAYYAVPCLGAVLHTLNLRLAPEQVAYTVNHARDRVLIVDDSLVPAMERIVPLLETVEQLIVVGDGATLPGALGYDELLAEAAPSSHGPSSTSSRPPPSVTRQARPATRRACSIRSARSASTR